MKRAREDEDKHEERLILPDLLPELIALVRAHFNSHDRVLLRRLCTRLHSMDEAYRDPVWMPRTTLGPLSLAGFGDMIRAIDVCGVGAFLATTTPGQTQTDRGIAFSFGWTWGQPALPNGALYPVGTSVKADYTLMYFPGKEAFWKMLAFRSIQWHGGCSVSPFCMGFPSLSALMGKDWASRAWFNHATWKEESAPRRKLV